MAGASDLSATLPTDAQRMAVVRQLVRDGRNDSGDAEEFFAYGIDWLSRLLLRGRLWEQCLAADSTLTRPKPNRGVPPPDSS